MSGKRPEEKQELEKWRKLQKTSWESEEEERLNWNSLHGEVNWISSEEAQGDLKVGRFVWQAVHAKTCQSRGRKAVQRFEKGFCCLSQYDDEEVLNANKWRWKILCESSAGVRCGWKLRSFHPPRAVCQSSCLGVFVHLCVGFITKRASQLFVFGGIASRTRVDAKTERITLATQSKWMRWRWIGLEARTPNGEIKDLILGGVPVRSTWVVCCCCRNLSV